ncbi:hypothetical protein [Clostridium sp.]
MDESYKKINSNNEEDKAVTVVLDKVTGMPINIDLCELTTEEG